MLHPYRAAVACLLLVLHLAVTAAGWPPAPADTAEWVSGYLHTDEDARILQAALCARACIETTGDGHELTGITATGNEDGEYQFGRVPYGRYAIAVVYERLDDAGNPIETGAAYLRDHPSGTSTLVPGFADASKTPVRAPRLALGSRWVDLVEVPVPPPPDPTVPGSARVTDMRAIAWPAPVGTDLEVTFAMHAIPRGAVVRLSLYGCRGAHHPQAVKTVHRAGSYRVEVEIEQAQHKFDRRVHWTTTITKRGYRPRENSGTWQFGGRWSCR